MYVYMYIIAIEALNYFLRPKCSCFKSFRKINFLFFLKLEIEKIANVSCQK